MAKMTPKQQRFCDEYLIDLNATQAAIRAGYSEKNARNIASENLAKPNINAYITDRMAEKESELIADQDEVLRYFTSVMRGESYSSVLARCEDGSETVIEKPPDEKERLDAAKQLAKRYGLDREEIEKQAKIEKLKAEIARLKGETPDDDKADDGFMDALKGEVESVWQEQ
jgi:phage terminase small subunit